jgi:cytochrome P450
MQDPMHFYGVLRDRFPMYRLDAYDGWAVSRFQDVWDVLTDNRHFTTAEGTLLTPDEARSHHRGSVPAPQYEPLGVLANTESPVHNQLRRAIDAPLRRRAVQELESFVRRVTRDRLDELVPTGRFDATKQYAGVVAAATMMHLLGISDSDPAMVLDSVNSAARGRAYPERQAKSTKLYRDLVLQKIGERRRAGADGSLPLVDGLIHYRLHGRPLTDQEMSESVLSIIMFGGAETLPKVLGHGLIELWRHPDQRAEIAANPANCTTAFEEILRYCAPIQWFNRTVSRTVVVGGQELQVGERVFLLLAAANRDEREFDQPEEFRWDRKMRRHLAFGAGLVVCIGNHLARLEGRILLEELLARIPKYDIDLEGAQRPPSSHQWAWTTVPVVVNH